jgi:hypothetical protein
LADKITVVIPFNTTEIFDAIFVLMERLSKVADIKIVVVLSTAPEIPKSDVIICSISSEIENDEGYKLVVEPSKVNIISKKPVGLFYAMQTIRQCLFL